MMDTVDKSKKSKTIPDYSAIAHQHDPRVVRAARPVVRWIVEKNFAELEFEGTQEALAIKNLPKFYLAQHWSYWDTILIPYGLHMVDPDMLPMIGAGSNLPLKFILRRLGAFMIARNGTGYINEEGLRTIKGYMTQMLIDGKSELLFPGWCKNKDVKKTGRSFNGSHQELTSLAFRSVQDASEQGTDTHLIAVNEIYDRVPEDNEILALIEWKAKLPRLQGMMYTIDFPRTFRPRLPQSRRSALIMFGKPHSFSELRETMTVGKIRKFYEKEIRDLYRPTALDISCAAVSMCGEKQSYNRKDVTEAEYAIIDRLTKQGVKFFSVSSDIKDLEERVQQIAPDILRFRGDQVEVMHKELLTFYSNRISHLLPESSDT